jgi:sugar-phosphatase
VSSVSTRPAATVLRGDAILFDLDGVLVDSAAEIARAWSGWAADHGLSVARVLELAPGRPGESTIRSMAPQLSDAEVARHLRDTFRRQLDDPLGTPAMPGAREALDSAATMRWAVVTSCSTSLATKRLDSAGLPLPDVLVTCDDVEVGKPSPEGYLAAARRLAVAPARCIVIEDSPLGVEAARRGGMAAIALGAAFGPTSMDAWAEGLHAVRVECGASRVLVRVGANCAVHG